MAIPSFDMVMLPLLKLISDGKEHSVVEVVDNLANYLGLSKEEVHQLLPSGKHRTFYNRVIWAKTYLAKAGLVTAPCRGFYQITEQGMHVLNGDYQQLNLKFLKQFSGYLEFVGKKTTEDCMYK